MSVLRKAIFFLIILSSSISCDDGQPSGSVIPFAEAVGSYSGLCRELRLPTQTLADSVQTNMSVSATTLESARFQSGCISSGSLTLGYVETKGDTIKFEGLEGKAYFLMSISTIEVVSYDSDLLHTLFTGTK